jgi:hypothetical protein
MTANRLPDGPRGDEASGPQYSRAQDMPYVTMLVRLVADHFLQCGLPPDMTRAVMRAAIDALMVRYPAPRPDSESPGLSCPFRRRVSAPRALLGRFLELDGVNLDDLDHSQTRARVRAAAEWAIDRARWGWTPVPLVPEQDDLEPMHDDPLFDELREISPMFGEYQRQRHERGEAGRVFSLTELWKAAGRPRGRSPRHYAHVFRKTRSDWIEDRGGGPDGAVLADGETAFHYCTITDDRIMTAVITHVIEFTESLTTAIAEYCRRELIGRCGAAC